MIVKYTFIFGQNKYLEEMTSQMAENITQIIAFNMPCQWDSG